MADHYAVLGVRPDAHRSAIQAAYRELARRYHPDFGGDESKMAALNEAWAVLGRDETRVAYDASRRNTQSIADEAVTPRPQPAGPIAAAAARRAAATRGRTLGFGRYADWTIAELATHDPTYLEWLARAPAGLMFRQEIYTELARRPSFRAGRSATTLRQPQARARLVRARLW